MAEHNLSQIKWWNEHFSKRETWLVFVLWIVSTIGFAVSAGLDLHPVTIGCCLVINLVCYAIVGGLP